ncbi:hypothetical protein EV126DRAFT_237356 [Verticillium dahliae]|nr:hypothetical protein EV126DRAFT_237356 [Verticillium dahliae]
MVTCRPNRCALRLALVIWRPRTTRCFNLAVLVLLLPHTSYVRSSAAGVRSIHASGTQTGLSCSPFHNASRK